MEMTGEIGGRMEYTGYWIFYCNPTSREDWQSEFIADMKEGQNTRWFIAPYQKKYFKRGQYGAIHLIGRKFPKGIYAIGHVESEAYEDNEEGRDLIDLSIISLLKPPLLLDDIKGYKEIANESSLDIRWNQLRILREETGLKSLQLASTWPLSVAAFERIVSLGGISDKVSGSTNRGETTEETEYFAESGSTVQSGDEDTTIAEEIYELHETLYEGAQKTIVVNAYERNRKAKVLCTQHWGTRCSVCGFDFEKFYGPIGKDCIHVHHLKPLSQIEESYKVDPIEDLRPVCPNCHAMLHVNPEQVLSIKELKQLIDRCRKTTT